MIVVALLAGGQIFVDELLPFGLDVEPEAPELLGVVLGVRLFRRSAGIAVVVHQATPDAEYVATQAFDVGGEDRTVQRVGGMVIDRVIVDAEPSPFDVAQVGLFEAEERFELDRNSDSLSGRASECAILTSAKVFV